MRCERVNDQKGWLGGHFLTAPKHSSDGCGDWGDEVWEMGVICDSACSNKKLTTSSAAETGYKVPAPGHMILQIRSFLRSAGCTDAVKELCW